MKTTTGSMCGLLSSLLFNVGLIRLAERLDPTSAISATEDMRPGEPCVQWCNWQMQLSDS